MDCKQAKELISAYADGELDEADRDAAKKHLETCTDCSRELERLSALKSAIGNAALLYNVPGALQKRIETLVNKAADPPADGKPRIGRPLAPLKFAAMALAAGLVLAAGIAGYRVLWPSERQRIGAEAVQDHKRSLLSNHPVDVASSDPATVLRWLGGKLSYAPVIPNRIPTGYALVGGRVDGLDGRRVGVLVYRNGTQFSEVFQYPSSGPSSASDVNTIQGLGVASWNMGGMNFFVVADAGPLTAGDIAGTFQSGGCSAR